MNVVPHEKKLVYFALILRPVIRFCFRHSVAVQEFWGIAKRLFVEVAQEELERRGERVNIHRISIFTGLHRKEVTELCRSEATPPDQGVSLTARVLNRWESDPQFTTKAGKPRTLSDDGPKSGFFQLVQSVAKHSYPGTVRDKMLKSGVIERHGKRLRLRKQPVYIEKDHTRGFTILSRGVDRFLRAVEENLLVDPSLRNLHIHTEFTDVREREVERIRGWLLEEGKKSHARARQIISTVERDVSDGELEEAAHTVTYCSFSFTAPHSELIVTADKAEE